MWDGSVSKWGWKNKSDWRKQRSTGRDLRRIFNCDENSNDLIKIPTSYGLLPATGIDFKYIRNQVWWCQKPLKRS